MVRLVTSRMIMCVKLGEIKFVNFVEKDLLPKMKDSLPQMDNLLRLLIYYYLRGSKKSVCPKKSGGPKKSVNHKKIRGS